MYKIDIKKFSTFNSKYNDFIISCFKFCSEYNRLEKLDYFSINKVYKIFEDNNERAFINIIKKSHKLRNELISFRNDINNVETNYEFQTKYYYQVISGEENLASFIFSKDLKEFFERIYTYTTTTDVFIKYSEEVGLKSFKYIFSEIQLDTNICPYCNAVHVTSVYSKDHFLPKSKFPLLAIWLENLVISCQQCNEGLKTDLVLLPSLHPYFNNICDYFKFKYKYTATKEIELFTEIDINKTALEQLATQNYLKVFNIEDRVIKDLSSTIYLFLNEIRGEVESECIFHKYITFEQIKSVLKRRIDYKIGYLNQVNAKQALLNSKLKIDILNSIDDNIINEVELIQFNINAALGLCKINSKVYT